MTSKRTNLPARACESVSHSVTHTAQCTRSNWILSCSPSLSPVYANLHQKQARPHLLSSCNKRTFSFPSKGSCRFSLGSIQIRFTRMRRRPRPRARTPRVTTANANEPPGGTLSCRPLRLSGLHAHPCASVPTLASRPVYLSTKT